MGNRVTSITLHILHPCDCLVIESFNLSFFKSSLPPILKVFPSLVHYSSHRISQNHTGREPAAEILNMEETKASTSSPVIEALDDHHSTPSTTPQAAKHDHGVTLIPRPSDDPRDPLV